MQIDKVFVNTHKYDFYLAKVCIASIRYWYPDIPIILIKEYGQGDFSTEFVEKFWNVEVLRIKRKKFGWGFGKLEPLFLEGEFNFLVLDADTVFTGPVLNAVAAVDAEFVVDREVQTAERFNQIYYSLEKINSVEKDFSYPGYSFNAGQWYGTTGKIERKDFDKCILWSEPPKTSHPEIFFNGDQGPFNFVIHWLEQTGKIKVEKIKIMIWPNDGNADHIELSDLKNKKGSYPFIIHWAGISFNNMGRLPRADIHNFYKSYYYLNAGKAHLLIDTFVHATSQMKRRIKRFKSKFKAH